MQGLVPTQYEANYDNAIIFYVAFLIGLNNSLEYKNQ